MFMISIISAISIAISVISITISIISIMIFVIFKISIITAPSIC
jgi:hypothetical protein